jgi:hypothetical protein
MMRQIATLLAKKIIITSSTLPYDPNQQGECKLINDANDRHLLKKGLTRPFAVTVF